MEKDKVNFEEYGMEFRDNELNDMTVEEVQECKNIISDIRKLLEG